MSANDKVGNEVRSSGIYLTAEENSGKPQLGDHLMKAVHPVIASNGVPYLQMRLIGSQHVKKGEGKLDRVGDSYIKNLLLSMEPWATVKKKALS